MSRVRWGAAAIGMVLTVIAYAVLILIIIPFAASVTDTFGVAVVLVLVLAAPLRLAVGALIALLALRGDRGAQVAPVITTIVGVTTAHLLLTAGTISTIGFEVTRFGVIGDLLAHLHDLAWWVGTAALGAWLVSRRAHSTAPA